MEKHNFYHVCQKHLLNNVFGRFQKRSPKHRFQNLGIIGPMSVHERTAPAEA